MTKKGETMEIRLACWNIQHGAGGLARVADVLELLQWDILALNEVDNGLSRSGFVKQASWLGRRFGCHAFFGPAAHGSYGNALLSHRPPERIENLRLPGGGEPRGCLRTSFELNGISLHVYVTHLGLRRSWRQIQADQIAEWMGRYALESTVLLGDFNADSEASELRPLRAGGLRDVSGTLGVAGTTYRDKRIDQIWAGQSLTPLDAGVLQTSVSDHAPIYAVLNLRAITPSFLPSSHV